MRRALLPSIGVVLLAFWLSSPARNVEMAAQRELPVEIPAEIPSELPVEIPAELPAEIPVELHASLLTDTRVRRFSAADFFALTLEKIPEKFEVTTANFVPHSSCRRNSQELLGSFKNSISASKISARNFIPESGQIADLNYYLEFRGKFFQVSVESVADAAGRFRISLIQSTTADFSKNTERLPIQRLAQLHQDFTQEEALRELAGLVQDYARQGARWGTRTALLTSIESVEGNTPAEVRAEFHNGMLRGFMNSSQECQLTEGNELECRCW